MVGESQETVGVGGGSGPSSNKTPTLEEYGNNLTQQAREVRCAPWHLCLETCLVIHACWSLLQHPGCTCLRICLHFFLWGTSHLLEQLQAATIVLHTSTPSTADAHSSCLCRASWTLWWGA